MAVPGGRQFAIGDGGITAMGTNIKGKGVGLYLVYLT